MDIKKIALELFKIEDPSPSRSGGAHMVSLRSVIDRSDFPDQLAALSGEINEYIDHTLLNPAATESDIIKLCQEADRFRFASVCINPCWVELAAQYVQKASICTVTGFPLGADTPMGKAFQTRLAIEQGASEIDMVINIGQLKSGHYDLVYQDIAIVSDTCKKHNVLLKVIIETCLLTDEEKVIACLLSKKAGADFVKTSTGFSSAGATLADVILMREVVGAKMGVKAAGGIRSEETARAMLAAGANRIGTSSGIKIVDSQLTIIGSES